MDRPSISVILPVRNAALTVGRTIESVLEQTLTTFEIVVIDDHSQDETYQVVASYDDDRIRLFPASGFGLASALNQALRLARSPFAARIDGDDWMLPHRLEVQSERLVAEAHLVLISSPAEVFSPNGQLLGTQDYLVTNDAMKLLLLRETGFSHVSVAYRIAAVQSVGGYRASSFPAEDYDLWVRLAIFGKGQWLGLPDTLTCVQRIPGSVSDHLSVEQACKSAIARMVAQRSRITLLATRHTLLQELAMNPQIAGSRHLARLQEACLRACVAHASTRDFRHLVESGRATITGGPQLAREIPRRSLRRMMRKASSV